LKILFTNECRREDGYYEYFGKNSKALARIVFPIKISTGLRFIKQNFPRIEILENPTWDEYCAWLSEGWDVVGFSFFTHGTGRALKMVEKARQAGVSQIWGGGYGVLDPRIQDRFDRIFHGYAEPEIAEALGVDMGPVRHPPLVNQWNISPLPFKVQRVAALFTSRGCPYKCTFCQTPVFCPRPETLPLESIEEVLRFYRDHGVDWVFVMDENFGMFKEHSEKVVEMFPRFGLHWSLMTRAENALKYLDDWVDANLMGIGVGIESMDHRALAAWKKKQTTETVARLAEELERRKRYMWGYYMLGHQDADVDSTLEEIEMVRALKLGFTQVTIATPYPRTALWDELEQKYGIFETDWEKYDTKHLVWNHPHISPEKMEELHDHACRRLNSSAIFLRFAYKIYRSYAMNLASYARGLSLISSFPVKCYRYPEDPGYLPAR